VRSGNETAFRTVLQAPVTSVTDACFHATPIRCRTGTSTAVGIVARVRFGNDAAPLTETSA
jgi:hypothetical protein